jgi:Calreticulin family
MRCSRPVGRTGCLPPALQSKPIPPTKSSVMSISGPSKTPYAIMFGPDKFGATNKVHVIFCHKNPPLRLVRGEVHRRHSLAPHLQTLDPQHNYGTGPNKCTKSKSMAITSNWTFCWRISSPRGQSPTPWAANAARRSCTSTNTGQPRPSTSSPA